MPIVDTDQALQTAADELIRSWAAACRAFDAKLNAVETLTGRKFPRDGFLPSHLRKAFDISIRTGEVSAASCDSKPSTNLQTDVSSLTELVRWAVQRFDDDFTTPQVACLLEKHGHAIDDQRQYISSVMDKLARRLEVERVAPGAGRRPAIFRYTRGKITLRENHDADVTPSNGHEELRPNSG